LKGRRGEAWSLTVTRNRRLAFRADDETLEITDLDDADDH